MYLRVLAPLDVVTNDDEALGLGPPDHTDVVSCRHITHPQHLIHLKGWSFWIFFSRLGNVLGYLKP